MVSRHRFRCDASGSTQQPRTGSPPKPCTRPILHVRNASSAEFERLIGHIDHTRIRPPGIRRSPPHGRPMRGADNPLVRSCPRLSKRRLMMVMNASTTARPAQSPIGATARGPKRPSPLPVRHPTRFQPAGHRGHVRASLSPGGRQTEAAKTPTSRPPSLTTSSTVRDGGPRRRGRARHRDGAGRLRRDHRARTRPQVSNPAPAPVTPRAKTPCRERRMTLVWAGTTVVLTTGVAVRWRSPSTAMKGGRPS